MELSNNRPSLSKFRITLYPRFSLENGKKCFKKNFILIFFLKNFMPEQKKCVFLGKTLQSRYFSELIEVLVFSMIFEFLNNSGGTLIS